MTSLTAKQAQGKLNRLLDIAAHSHKPIQITGRKNNAILLGESDWKSIQETLYLVSIPKMRESIRRGLKTSLKKCSKKLVW